MPKSAQRLAVAAAVLACIAVSACNRQGEHVTATGDELSAEFASQDVETTPKSYEPALPQVEMPEVSSVSASVLN